MKPLTAEEIVEWREKLARYEAGKFIPSDSALRDLPRLLDEVERTRAQKRRLRLALSAIADEQDSDDDFEARLKRCTEAAFKVLQETGADAEDYPLLDPVRTRALLRRIEWKGEGESSCPACDGQEPQHRHGCELAALLGGGG